MNCCSLVLFSQIQSVRRCLLVTGLSWLLGSGSGWGQNTRLIDRNTIGWFSNTTTLQWADRWSVHLEYQLRRDDFVMQGQQNLLRTGVNYRAADKLTLRLGYAFVETYPYGDYTIQAAGRTFPEHRLYQMALLNNPIGRVEVSHRFMLEQRWVGRYLNPDSPHPDETVYTNRIRYMARAQMPIGKPTMGDRTLYAAAYNEVFIGMGRNVAENVFDQNRLGLLLGYRVNKALRVEGGYFQQILQLPREIQNRNVFQNNQGLIVNTVLQIDLRRKQPL